tara:strand:+ start:1274 stop:1510 length:237 start_codon:yes stop_codon:yes gene_type:complete
MIRQQFDIGDLVKVSYPYENKKSSWLGLVTDKKVINANLLDPDLYKWHPDEYSCLIRFLGEDRDQWVRAKYLKTVSKA